MKRGNGPQKTLPLTLLFLAVQLWIPGSAHAADYAIGADLSFLKQAEDKGSLTGSRESDSRACVCSESLKGPGCNLWLIPPIGCWSCDLENGVTFHFWGCSGLKSEFVIEKCFIRLIRRWCEDIRALGLGRENNRLGGGPNLGGRGEI
jgi:hypothetical protein